MTQARRSSRDLPRSEQRDDDEEEKERRKLQERKQQEATRASSTDADRSPDQGALGRDQEGPPSTYLLVRGDDAVPALEAGLSALEPAAAPDAAADANDEDPLAISAELEALRDQVSAALDSQGWVGNVDHVLGVLSFFCRLDPSVVIADVLEQVLETVAMDQNPDPEKIGERVLMTRVFATTRADADENDATSSSSAAAALETPEQRAAAEALMARRAEAQVRSDQHAPALLDGARGMLDPATSPMWSPSAFGVTGVPIVTQRDRGRNAFTSWIVNNKAYDEYYPYEPSPEPQPGQFMNCWEAVFFAAYRANLIDHRRLVEIYRDVKEADTDAYGKFLMNALNYDLAVEITPTHRPRAGDIIFLNCNEHVMLCEDDQHVLQLWHEGNATHLANGSSTGRFSRKSLDEFLAMPQFSDKRFAPSPF